ncbi:Longitudinals lacking protein, isoforms A/B/D/L [Frankliniella fusca]|uniref:Longitudinals lacking protein, isoforms A/B/D/L n=1 Tax=Frankliniella fusca TaxID=407009 RepID=A0AAE1H6E8_9NEOP|nr:Longitudinals lacking protein, isoforms A/B/D/L [Frankliniella fusca]
MLANKFSNFPDEWTDAELRVDERKDHSRILAAWALVNQPPRLSNSLNNLPPLPDGITVHPVNPTPLVTSARPIGKSPGRFECPRCGKVYRWKGNLKQHLNVECGKEPQLQCLYCIYRCKHKSSMNRHMKHLHAWSPGAESGNRWTTGADSPSRPVENGDFLGAN